MAREKTKRTSNTGQVLLPGWWRGLSADGRRRMLIVAAHVLLAAAMVAGVFYGLNSASEYVRGLNRYAGPVDVVLLVRHRKDDVLVTVRDLAYANLPGGAEVIYRDTDAGTGQLVVEYAGQCVQVLPEDVTAAWLRRFDGPGDRLIAQAMAIANAQPDGSDRPDWFDSATLDRLHEKIARNPYVQRVVQLERQLLATAGDGGDFQRRIILNVELRRPLAQIWFPPPGTSRTMLPTCYVLDRTGLVLEQREAAASELPHVVGFAVSRQQAGGSLIPGQMLALPDVQAGLELLNKLSNQPYFQELAQVDVSNFERRRNKQGSELVLCTRPTQILKPQEIWWGLRNENRMVEYNTTLEKLQILHNIWSTHGRLNMQDRYPGPYSLYHARGQPFQPDADGGSLRSSRSGNF